MAKSEKSFDAGNFYKSYKLTRHLDQFEAEDLMKKMNRLSAGNARDSSITIEPDTNDGHFPFGFINGRYGDGSSYLFMTFAKDTRSTYSGVVLRADTPSKKRRELTERLAADVVHILETTTI